MCDVSCVGKDGFVERNIARYNPSWLMYQALRSFSVGVNSGDTPTENLFFSPSEDVFGKRTKTTIECEKNVVLGSKITIFRDEHKQNDISDENETHSTHRAGLKG